MRHDHWPSRLAEYVEAKRYTPFAWGTNDCCTFAAEAVQAMTGVLPALPSYSNEREAMRAMRDLGGVREAVTRLFEPTTVQHAQRGDLLLVRQPDGREMLAVALGLHWCAPGEAGLVFGPQLEAELAWRVE